MNKKLVQEHGQAVVIIALAMVGIIAMMGLIFDGGNVYIQRRHMQNAADAAALAGGRAMALERAKGVTNGDDSRVQQAVLNYASYNNAGTGWNAIYVDANNNQVDLVGNGYIPFGRGATGIRVTTNTSFPTFFLGMVNIPSAPASATALVQTGSPTGPSLFPAAIPTNTLVSRTPSGTQCQFNLDNNPICEIWGASFGSGSSGWTCLDTGNCGANDLRAWIDGTSPSPKVSIGDWIDTKTGVDGGSATTLSSYVTSGKPVIVPIYDQYNNLGGGNLSYRVSSFAVFKITGYHFSSSNEYGPYSGNSCQKSGGDYNCGCGWDSQIVCGKFVQWAESSAIDPNRTCSYGLCGFSMRQ